MSIPASFVSAVSSNSRRVVLLVLTIALALATLLAPQLSSNADAATAHRLSPKLTQQYARQMLKTLNAERRAHGLRPVVMNQKLIWSAFWHDRRMANRNNMSHQLPGEAFFADRIQNQGYNWQLAGENIGWNSDLSAAGVQYLEREMYNEKAPNDGHRLNILNPNFTNVGIVVRYDSVHHKIWFTQDFGRPMR